MVNTIENEKYNHNFNNITIEMEYVSSSYENLLEDVVCEHYTNRRQMIFGWWSNDTRYWFKQSNRM